MTSPQAYPALGHLLCDLFRILWPQDDTNGKIAKGLSNLRAEVDPGGQAFAHTTIGRWKSGETPPRGANLNLLLEYFHDSANIGQIDGGRNSIEATIHFLSQPSEVLATWYRRDDVPPLALNALKTAFPKPDATGTVSDGKQSAAVNIRNNRFVQGGIRDVQVEDGSRFDVVENEAETFIVTNVQVGSKRLQNDE